MLQTLRQVVVIYSPFEIPPHVKSLLAFSPSSGVELTSSHWGLQRSTGICTTALVTFLFQFGNYKSVAVKPMPPHLEVLLLRALGSCTLQHSLKGMNCVNLYELLGLPGQFAFSVIFYPTLLESGELLCFKPSAKGYGNSVSVF